MSARGGVARLGRMALVAMVSWAAAGCDTIAASLFRPAAELTPDTTPPVFSNPRPAPEVAVVNTEAFTIQVTDPDAGGFPGSGVDPTRIEASIIGGGPLAVVVNLPMVTVLLVGAPETDLQVAVVARDRAGNSSVYVFTTALDRTPPSLVFLAAPAPAITASDAVLRVDFTIMVGADPHFDTGTIEIRTPGADGTCGTADDGSVPSPVVAQPSRTLPGPGTHVVQFFLNNPVPPGGAAQAVLYCWVATARDTARTADGTPGVNTSRAVSSSLVTWRRPAG